MMPAPEAKKHPSPTPHPAFDDFVATIAALRAPDGCPWDREQTHASIASNMLEEAYEAVDAIESDDIPHLREELGDVLLQVVIQSQIAADAGEFTIDDVCADVDAKIIRRHPHVFGDAAARNANDVITLWDKIKLKEKADTDATEGSSGEPKGPKRLLDSIPCSFPALMQAQKISRKAAAAGFEWETLDDIWAKVDEEIAELKDAYARAPKDEKGKLLHDGPHRQSANDAELELGDVLFSLVNVARRMGIDAERALRATCRKFKRRWETMEDAAARQGQALEEMDVEAQNRLWDDTKC